MATHFSFDELGIQAGDIGPDSMVLRNTPPPTTPLQTIAQHLGPAPMAQSMAPAPQHGWDNIFKPGGMGA